MMKLKQARETKALIDDAGYLVIKQFNEDSCKEVSIMLSPDQVDKISSYIINKRDYLAQCWDEGRGKEEEEIPIAKDSGVPAAKSMPPFQGRLKEWKIKGVNSTT